jgi:hypothetical protein
MEQQMSEGSQSYPECSTSNFVNTISFAFYQLHWQEREKLKSTLCMNRNIQRPINMPEKKYFYIKIMSHD